MPLSVPSTEQLVLALQAAGHEKGIDAAAVVRLGAVGRKLYAEKGNDPLHFVSGAARLHSRDARQAIRRANEEARDPTAVMQSARRMLAAGGADAVARFDELIEGVVASAPRANTVEPPRELIDWLARRIATRSDEGLSSRVKELAALAKKRRKRTLLHLYRHRGSGAVPRPLAFESSGWVGLSAAVDARPPELSASVVVVDPALELAATSSSSELRLPWPTDALVASATRWLVLALDPSGQTPLDVSDAPKPIAELLLRANTVPRESPAIRIVSSAARALARDVQRGERIVIASIEPPGMEEVAALRARGAEVLRPPFGPTLVAEVDAILAVKSALAATDCDPRWVAPLAAAGPGQHVVDDALCPSVLCGEGAIPDDVATAIARARARALLDAKRSL
jgi:hypothetical protein